MPLDEEGAKWSCEPCVRGHRSSKCQHFDRLMMKVPKAGRPLAKCPHPKGTCSCQKLYAFMVRIPKGSTCLCRPLYKVPAVAAENGEEAPPATSQPPADRISQSMSEMSPPVLAPTAKPNGGIRKRTKRQNSTRTLPELSTKDLATLPELQSETKTEGQPLSASVLNSAFSPHYSAAPFSPYDSGPPASNALSPLSTEPQVEHSKPAMNSKTCCSKTAPNPTSSCETNAVKKEPSVTAGLDSVNMAAIPHTASCPPSYPFPSDPMRPSVLSPNSGFQHTNHLSQTQSAPVTHYSSPTIHPQYDSTTYMSKSPEFQYMSHQYPPGLFPVQADSNHNCGCGEGCQCLGCASHPFNETTRQHIQEMGFLITTRGESPKEDGNSPSGDQQQYPSDPGYAHFHHSNANHGHGLNNPNQAYASHHFEHTMHLPNTDSMRALPAVPTQNPGEMMMQPNAYLTVEYPVNLLDPCTNMTGTCQCGLSCACVGCLTHHGHNGVALEPSPPPEHADFHMTTSGLPMPNGSASFQMPMYTDNHNHGDYQQNSSCCG